MAGGVLARQTPEQRNRLLMVGAIVFSLIAAVLIFVALQNATEDGGGSAALTTDVVVAAENVSANTVLTEDMLEVRAVPADQALNGVFSDVEDAVGLPARYPLQVNEQVTTAKIGVEEITDEDDLALVLEQGQRAAAVEVTEVTSVGGNLLPGNFVDVIAVFNGGEEGLQDDFAVTLVQNVEVLAVAQTSQEPVPAPSEEVDAAAEGTGSQGVTGQRPEDVEREPGARTVTLRLNPAQARLLALVQAEGDGGANTFDVSLMLTLRATGDNQTEQGTETGLPPEILQLIPPPPPEQ